MVDMFNIICKFTNQLCGGLWVDPSYSYQPFVTTILAPEVQRAPLYHSKISLWVLFLVGQIKLVGHSLGWQLCDCRKFIRM